MTNDGKAANINIGYNQTVENSKLGKKQIMLRSLE
jgi:hypothetical protein